MDKLKSTQSLFMQGLMVLVLALALLALMACSTHVADEVNIEARYQVNADLSLTLKSGDSDDVDVTAWQKVVHLLPDDILKNQISEYHVFTDGEDESLAFVNVMEGDDSKWAFGLDYTDSENANSTKFVTTVVHEFTHVVTLENQQVKRFVYDDNGYSNEDCPTMEIEEGCLLSDSYLLDFIMTFWDDSDYQAYQADIAKLTGKKKQNAIADFYSTHTDSFVNEYAATDPMEDFAETFAFFVLSDIVTNPETVKDEKYAFFNKYPALMEIRKEIRRNTSVRR